MSPEYIPSEDHVGLAIHFVGSPGNLGRSRPPVYLILTQELPKLGPALVIDRPRVFIGPTGLSNDNKASRQRPERLSTMFARCTFCHLSVKDPTSNPPNDLRQRYDRIVPFDTDFTGLSIYDTTAMIHISIKERSSPGPFERHNDGPSAQERIPLAWYVTKAA
jgi:hypothetical protein